MSRVAAGLDKFMRGTGEALWDRCLRGVTPAGFTTVKEEELYGMLCQHWDFEFGRPVTAIDCAHRARAWSYVLLVVGVFIHNELMPYGHYNFFAPTQSEKGGRGFGRNAQVQREALLGYNYEQKEHPRDFGVSKRTIKL